MAGGGSTVYNTEKVKNIKNKLGTILENEFTYEYTGLGEIGMITGNKVGQKVEYEYDALSRLTREDNAAAGKTILYSYDSGGNILAASEYPYQPEKGANSLGSPVSETVYSYPGSGWKDQLDGIEVDGGALQGITYDAIGNPTGYLGKALTWERGRKLTGITDGSTETHYAYSTEGARLSKTVDESKTAYTYIGGMLVQEKNAAYELDYYYDTNGLLVSIGYKASGASAETCYFVMRNAQGDIIAVYNSADSSLVGTYIYDSWGKMSDPAAGKISPASYPAGFTADDYTGVSLAGPTSDPNGIMAKNPFRYRGYYYDRETGFYFLQSRYYDPGIKRFINADGLISTGTGVTGYNMFSYCNNNPVNLSDPTGQCSVCAYYYRMTHPYPTLGSYQSYNVYLYATYQWERAWWAELSRTHPAPIGPLVTSAPSGESPGSSYPTVDPSNTSCEFHCQCGGHAGTHTGKDMLGHLGEPIFAVMTGIIKIPSNETGYGNQVEIISWDVTRTYSHLDEIFVYPGQEVVAGTIIGTMGKTGYVTHLQPGWGVLHVETIANGVKEDPRGYAPWKG